MGGGAVRPRYRSVARCRPFLHAPAPPLRRPSAGDPLIGPSALDAVAAGAVFINPVFPAKKLEFFESQHPFLASAVGEPHVCNAALDDTAAVLRCVRKAVELDLPPRVPEQMAPTAYLARLEALLEPAVS
jgi:hypothetical protein